MCNSYECVYVYVYHIYMSCVIFIGEGETLSPGKTCKIGHNNVGTHTAKFRKTKPGRGT